MIYCSDMPVHKCKRCTQPAIKAGYCAKHSNTIQYVDKRKLAGYQKGRKRRNRGSRRREYALSNDDRMADLARTWLRQNPFCIRCRVSTRPLGYEKRTPAAHVDHIKPVAKYPELRYDTNNFQSLCISCHSKKSAYERRGEYHDYGRELVYKQ